MCLIDGPADADNREVSCADRAPRFTVQEVAAVGERTLVLAGELDLASRPLLDAAIARLEREGASALTLDLRDVTFMDSTGLHGVLLAKAACERSGGRFMLVRGSAQVQRLFELSGLIDELPFGEAAAA
jgi:anti-sigma B factor antagonist